VSNSKSIFNGIKFVRVIVGYADSGATRTNSRWVEGNAKGSSATAAADRSGRLNSDAEIRSMGTANYYFLGARQIQVDAACVFNREGTNHSASGNVCIAKVSVVIARLLMV